MFGLRSALLLSAAIGWAGSTTAASEEWIEVRSPHFTVLTDADEGSGRRIAREFELIRAVFQPAFGHSLVDPTEPIFIYALEQEAGMAELLPHIWNDETRAKPVGLFRRGPDRHYVALTLDVGGERPYSTIYHEYFHLLVTSNLGDIPLWLNEGLASFWATTEIWANDVRIGGADWEHVQLLRQEGLLPLSILFEVDHGSPYYKDSDKAGIFYAQSWALVHYLMVGNSLGKDKLALYLRLLRESPDPEAEALGNPALLEKLLNDYVQRFDYRGRPQGRPPPVPEDAFEARALAPAETLALKAAFLTHGESPELGLPLIERSLDADPTLSLGYEVKAYYFLARGEPGEALLSLEKAIELHSDSFLAHYHYAGLVLQTRSPIEKAFAGLAAAIMLNPDFAPAHLFLAELAGEWMRELDAGLVSAERAIELAPRAPAARRALAVVRAARGELAEAAQAYRNAIALDPGSPALRAELGAVLAEAGEAEEAVDAFRQAIELAPGSPALHFAMAIQLLALERYEAAADAFEAVRANAPEDAELYHAMGRAFAGADRLEQALTAFRKAESLDPYDAEIAADHAAALEQAGRREEAIDAYRRAIEQEPEVGKYHQLLAAALERAGRTEDAKKHFEEARRLGLQP